MNPDNVNKKKNNRICEECGNNYLSFSYKAKYCDGCKLIVKRRKHKEYTKKKRREKRLSQELKCEICGADIRDIKYAKKYCSKCKSLVAITRSKKYYSDNIDKISIRQKEYDSKPENKDRHRIIARESARRKRERDKLK